MLASNVDEQGLKEGDIAFNLNGISESLNGEKFTNTLEGVEDIDSYSKNVSTFLGDVTAGQLKLVKYQTEIDDLQKEIDGQREVDLAAAEKTGVPLEDWYKQYGQEEFARENAARAKLADANASFQESQLGYIDKLSGQAQVYLDGWGKLKGTANGETDLQTVTDLRKLLNDTGAGTDSLFGTGLKSLRDTSRGSNQLTEDATRYQGELPQPGEKPPTPYEQSKLFKELGVKDSGGAIDLIDKGIKGFTGKDSAIHQLITLLRDEESRLQNAGEKTPSEPFLPPNE